MTKRVKNLSRSALIAALYITLTYLQELLLPGFTSMAIQFRISEALCILALYSPTAVWGLTVGCLVFNISNAALPPDIFIGSLATLIATGGMYLTRKVTVFGYPLLAMLLPAIVNGLLIGWELSVYVGGGFWLNALYVAIGEAAVLFLLGSVLFYVFRSRQLGQRLFS